MPTPTGNPSIECPSCQGAMIEEDYGPAYIDRCGSCGGRWFDSTELDALIEGRHSDRFIKFSFASAGEETDRRCPRCTDETLRGRTLGAVTIQWCDGCRGFFVSGSQLELLRRSAPRDHVIASGGGAPVAEAVEILLGILLSMH